MADLTQELKMPSGPKKRKAAKKKELEAKHEAERGGSSQVDQDTRETWAVDDIKPVGEFPFRNECVEANVSDKNVGTKEIQKIEMNKDKGKGMSSVDANAADTQSATGSTLKDLENEIEFENKNDKNVELTPGMLIDVQSKLEEETFKEDVLEEKSREDNYHFALAHGPSKFEDGSSIDQLGLKRTVEAELNLVHKMVLILKKALNDIDLLLSIEGK